MTMSSLPSYESAIEAALVNVKMIAEVQTVPRLSALGRVVTEPVLADRDQPPFDRSMLDGYAVQAASVSGATLEVEATIPAGTASTCVITPSTTAAIATGAPVPRGADAVIGHECTDRREPVTIGDVTVAAGDGVHRRGRDAEAGETVIAPPALATARHIAVAATMGYTSLSVRRRPQVAILSSGDEVVDPATSPSPCQIRNSNLDAVAVLVRAMGGEVISGAHLVDEPADTEAGVHKAMTSADLVITIGGISAGDRDCFTEAVTRWTTTRSVTGAAIKPGKPIQVAHAQDVTVLSLPGNPVSAIVCAVLFGGPILNGLLGLDPMLRWCSIALANDAAGDASRTCFRPASITPAGCVEIPQWQGSGDLVHTAATDGIAWLPRGEDTLTAGTTIRFLPWPGGLC